MKSLILIESARARTYTSGMNMLAGSMLVQ